MAKKKPYKLCLTQKDETVDEGYIPIFELFSDSKYALPMCNKEEWCLSPQKLNSFRLETYREVKKRFELCQAESYASFWNGNLDEINALSLNRFACMTNFRELATAMICFEKDMKNQSNDKHRKFISWGIRRSVYVDYYKSKLEALKTGEEPKKVSLYDPKKRRNGNLYRQPRTLIRFGANDKIVEIDRNAVYYQFEHWCKIKGITKKAALYQAMLALMKEKPVTNGELKELGAYERHCDLDFVEVLIPEITVENEVKINCYIPKSIHTQMRQIIYQHNIDVDNIGKPAENVGMYVAQAIKELNEHAPLKYSNPKLYKEYIEAKKAKEYNERVANQK